MSTVMMMGFGALGGTEAPVVSANTGDHIVQYFSTTGSAYARIRYANDGGEDSTQILGAGADTIVDSERGTWLTSGSASDVWVERTIGAGTLDYDDDIGASRVNLGTSRTIGVSHTAPITGSTSCTLTLDFYDASSGGTLLQSVELTLTATVDIT